MVRYERVDGDILIAWGFDEVQDGFFLSVTDKRLETRCESSDEVNDICEKVSMGGVGYYFHLNTYKFGGFGYKVSEETIFAFMLRYKIEIAKMDLSERKVNASDSRYSTMVMGPVLPQHFSPDSVMKRRARLQKIIVGSVNQPVPIVVARIDRTIKELSDQYNIPIVRKGLVPPQTLSSTIFFFAQDAYPQGFQVCSHPDCCLPERDEVKHKKCSRCKNAVYCSKDCQNDDWKTHKKNCQKIE
ncbi:hypothetical protein BGX21_005547 [Mortierella sp. AD011]|nr:hypothetical protein BGX20_003841 [Mortierella sp. AD010]KAF9399833.1 hypothetical protein BGX21_005547 [Mortierella sp. AD011]